jgi:hypothetical protein
VNRDQRYDLENIFGKKLAFYTQNLLV